MCLFSKSKSVVLSLLFSALFCHIGMAQINIGSSSYTTLKAAFDDINAGNKTGTITITVTGNTTETTSCILNSSGTGSANYSSITLSTSGGPWTISGNLTAAHLIDLNGADNFQIDGGNNLTLSNTGLGASSVIRLYNDATGNLIKNCTLQGSTNASFGVITFGNGLVSGNDFNTIENCTIGAAGTNLPLNGIYSMSTTTGVENDNNSVNNCKIFDYFNANNPFFGIQLNSGNSAWTLSGNKLYQTASRTVATANTVSAIFISSGSAYNISSNTIGFSSASGTGTYAMTSTVALRFIGINCALAAGTATEINGNSISAISITTSSGAVTTNGVLCGINITGTGSTNIGTTTGNTIGSSSGTGSLTVTSTTTQALVVGVHSSSTGTINVKNNTFGGFRSGGTTATVAGAIMGINITGAATAVSIENNTIGNSTANNMQGGTLTSPTTTGSSICMGINIAVAIVGTVAILNNSIQNMTSYGTGSTGYVRGIATINSTSNTTIFTISNNTVNNLSTNATYSSYGNGLLTACGIGISTGINSVISGNTISNISCLNTGTLPCTAGGISIGNAAGTQIFSNRIFNITNAGTSTVAATPATASGIVVRSASGTLTIYNNMVSIGAGQSTNTCFVGIMCNNGSSPNPTAQLIYYNSINISGTVGSGAQPSFGIARTDFSATAKTLPVTIKNNLIVNTRSGGTGLHCAIANNYGATASASGWESNYNLLNAAAATIGYWTSSLNLSAWRSAAASDANSPSGIIVSFANPSIGDLHLTMGSTPTGIESGGTDIAGFSNDIDGDTRPGPTGSTNGGGLAPDLGADEFDGKTADLAAPTITVTPATNACTTSNRSFSANIKDASGVPLAGNLVPRVYFRKGLSGSWFSAAGSYNSGPSTDCNWDFTVDHNLMGGVSSGDYIYYYVIAQDIAGNLSSSPSGATALDVNTVSIAPSSLLIYQVAYAAMNGIFQVGSSRPAPFNTLSSAINTFNNSCSLTGAVVFELTDPLYSSAENFPIVINRHNSASAANTLTIRPSSGINATITGSLSNPQLIVCYNSFTNIDGSNNGTNSRNLTLGGASSSVVFYSAGNSATLTNCAIKNTIILNGAQTSSGIVVNDATPGSTGGFFNNIIISNNEIQKAFNGIYVYANPTVTGNGSGTIISDNSMTASGTNAIRINGLYMQGVSGAVISGNTIGNFESATLENDNAIRLFAVSNTAVLNNNISGLTCSNASTAAPTGIAVSSGCTDITVSGNNISGISTAGTNTPAAIAITSGTGFIVNANKISDVKNTNSGGWGAAGINMSGSDSRISNNFVSDVAANGFSNFGIGDNGNGIVLNGGSNHEVYHNTVLLNTNQTTAVGYPAALLLTSSMNPSATVVIKNNILANMQTNGNQRYTVVCSTASAVITDMDNNALYSTGPNLGYISNTQCSTLADITSYFGGNQNSFVELPIFVSSTDLHLNMGTTPTKFESGAVPIAGLTTDIDGNSRPGPQGTVNGGGSAPDVGADEFDGVKIPVLLSAKVFLEGVDTTSGLMPDYLRTVNFPMSDPYSNPANPYLQVHVNNVALATVSPAVLAVNGNNAIVDWVIVELRTGSSGATTVVATKAGLLQRDGDIVATDGVSPLTINASPGSYVVGIRHRNHLRFETDQPIALSTTATTLNFTNNSVALWGNYPDALNNAGGGKWMMISGDANADSSIDALDTPVWEIQNGLFDDYFLNGDYNLDGSIDALDSISWEINNGKFV